MINRATPSNSPEGRTAPTAQDQSERNDRPERRTALIAQELLRYKVDIAALSETRLADEGSLTEEGGGYTYFWKGY